MKTIEKQPSAALKGEPTIADVDLRIAKLDTRRDELQHELVQVRNKRQEIESSPSEVYIAGGADARRKTLELRVEEELLNGALDTLAKQRAQAVTDRRRAEASDTRRQADAKRVELAAMRAAVEPHLRALSKIEGIDYTAGILAAERVGTWAVCETLAAATHHAPSETFPEPVGPNRGTYRVPKSRVLIDEIASLLALADNVESELERSAAVELLKAQQSRTRAERAIA